jgi:hypothetical protein
MTIIIYNIAYRTPRTVSRSYVGGCITLHSACCQGVVVLKDTYTSYQFGSQRKPLLFSQVIDFPSPAMPEVPASDSRQYSPGS